MYRNENQDTVQFKFQAVRAFDVRLCVLLFLFVHFLLLFLFCLFDYGCFCKKNENMTTTIIMMLNGMKMFYGYLSSLFCLPRLSLRFCVAVISVLKTNILKTEIDRDDDNVREMTHKIQCRHSQCARRLGIVNLLLCHSFTFTHIHDAPNKYFFHRKVFDFGLRHD